MRDREASKRLEFHKEETIARIKSDEADRSNLRSTLKKCVNPLDTNIQALVNICSEIIVQDSVNAHDSVKIGEQQRKKFEASWPDLFYASIKKEVKTMKIGKKSSKDREIEIYNTELIHSRVMCLLSMGRIQLDDVLKYELSPIPLYLFESNGEMRPSKIKSYLKKALQVETSYRLQPKSNVIIIDGCAQLWSISWPTNGTVRNLADALYHVVVSYLTMGIDICLVFHRYYKYSIKGLTRAQRTGSIANNHVLSLDTPLPTRENTMTSTRNKVQVIDIISQYIIEKLTGTNYQSKFVVTFSEEIPIQVQNGVASPR